MSVLGLRYVLKSPADENWAWIVVVKPAEPYNRLNDQTTMIPEIYVLF